MSYLFVVAVGLVICYFAYLIGAKGKIEMIHDYHYRCVKQEDLPAYCKQFGWALGAIGAGVTLSGALEVVFTSTYTQIPLLIGIVIGLGIMHTTQMRYNGGWFKKPGMK